MATSKKTLAAESPEKVSTDNTVKAQETVVETEQPVEIKPAEKKTTEKKAAGVKATSKKAEVKSAKNTADKSSKKIAEPAENKPEPAEKKTKPAKKTSARPLTYEDIVAKTAKKVLAADITKIVEPISAQIVVYGECDGIFYVEIRDGIISVMPYDYKNADIEIIANSTELAKIVDGKLNVYEAISSGSFNIYGDAGKAVLFVKAAL